MKSLLLILALCLPLRAAFNSTMNFEVWPTSGADTNSGGFDPGVAIPGQNFSQQASPQVTYTDLVIGVTTTQATSVLHPFGTCTAGVGFCGNTIIIVSAVSGTCTAQTVEVLSTSTITATTDKALGTAGSVCNAVLGGSKATVSAAAALMVAGNTTWIKATGTYTTTSTVTVSVINLPTPGSFIGYTSTHGDNGQVTWTTSTNSVDLVSLAAGATDYLFQNIRFTDTAGTPGSGLRATTGNASNIAVVNCFFSGFLYAINGDFNVDFTFLGILVDSTEITACTSDGIRNFAYTEVQGSYIHGNGGAGINIVGLVSYPGLVIQNSVIKSNAGTAGVYISYDPNATNSFFLSIKNSDLINNTGDGLRVNNTHQLSVPPVTIWNTDFDSNGGHGINFAGGGSSWSWGLTGPNMRNNSYWNNTGSDVAGGISKDAADITLTGDPFVNRSGNNFTLNNTSGAGASMRGSGYPGTVTWGTSNTGYIDIGAFQHQGAAGGGAYGFVGP